MTDTIENLEPKLVKTPSGAITLQLGDEWVEDRVDPLGAAIRFADEEVVKDFDWIVLFGAGLGYRVARLRMLGVKNVCVIDPMPHFLRTVSEAFEANFEGAHLFEDSRHLLHELAGRIESKDKITFLSTKSYQRLFPEKLKEAANAVQEAVSYARLRWNSVKARAALATEAAIKNLTILPRVRKANLLDRPLEGIPAFIVSAGPSLDCNAHLLPEAAKRGAIFAVNTSAPVFAANEAMIDVLVSIEVLPVREALDSARERTRILAVPIDANPDSLDAPGFEKTIFCCAGAFPLISDRLEIPLIQYNGNVAMAAFALACEWGADPVILLGQDCAYTGGRLYAKGSGREGWRAIIEKETIAYECDEDYFELFTKRGIQAPRRTPRITVPGWGGTQVETVSALCETRRWLERAATLDKDRLFINATEGGARIEGFHEVRLAELIDTLPTLSILLRSTIHSTPKYEKEPLKILLDDMERSLREVEKAAEEALKSGPKRDTAAERLRAAANKLPIINYYCTRELMQIRENSSLPKKKRARLTFDVIHKSSQRLLQSLRDAKTSLQGTGTSQSRSAKKASNG